MRQSGPLPGWGGVDRPAAQLYILMLNLLESPLLNTTREVAYGVATASPL